MIAQKRNRLEIMLLVFQNSSHFHYLIIATVELRIHSISDIFNAVLSDKFITSLKSSGNRYLMALDCIIIGFDERRDFQRYCHCHYGYYEYYSLGRKKDSRYLVISFICFLSLYNLRSVLLIGKAHSNPLLLVEGSKNFA